MTIVELRMIWKTENREKNRDSHINSQYPYLKSQISANIQFFNVMEYLWGEEKIDKRE